MPQGVLPLFYDDATEISNLIFYQKKSGMIYYFYGSFPIFSHAENDEQSFRMFTSQLYVDGKCKQSEIVKAFGVTPISVKRSVAKYRADGPRAFFESKRSKNKPRVLTPDVLNRAQEMFNEGHSRQEVSTALGIKPDTLYRAIHSGRLLEKKKA